MAAGGLCNVGIRRFRQSETSIVSLPRDPTDPVAHDCYNREWYPSCILGLLSIYTSIGKCSSENLMVSPNTTQAPLLNMLQGHVEPPATTDGSFMLRVC